MRPSLVSVACANGIANRRPLDRKIPLVVPRATMVGPSSTIRSVPTSNPSTSSPFGANTFATTAS
jgi:hypothetical protein